MGLRDGAKAIMPCGSQPLAGCSLIVERPPILLAPLTIFGPYGLPVQILAAPPRRLSLALGSRRLPSSQLQGMASRRWPVRTCGSFRAPSAADACLALSCKGWRRGAGLSVLADLFGSWGIPYRATQPQALRRLARFAQGQQLCGQ